MQIFFCDLLLIFSLWSASFAHFFAQNVNLYAKHVIACKLTKIDGFSTESNIWRFIPKFYIQMSNDSAALNWILLVTKSSNWETNINKTEIRNLKIQNSSTVFIDVWIFVCRCLTWYFKCWLLLVECIWLKYQRSMPNEIKTTLKLFMTILCGLDFVV